MHHVKDSNVKKIRGFVSLALLRVFPGRVLDRSAASPERGEPLGYVFIIEPRFENNLAKLPGGTPIRGRRETWLHVVEREIGEETGIRIGRETFRYVGKQLCGKSGRRHWRCLFTADIAEGDRDWMHGDAPGNEGVVPIFCTHPEFVDMLSREEFLPAHRQLLQEFGLLPELGNDTPIPVLAT